MRRNNMKIPIIILLITIFSIVDCSIQNTVDILNTESTSWNGWVENSRDDGGWYKQKMLPNDQVGYTICELNEDGGDYWLRSPFIKSNEALSIKIEISFIMRSCNFMRKKYLYCKEAIYLLMYEANSPSDVSSSWNESIYTNVTVVLPNILWKDLRKSDNLVNVKTYSVELRKTGLFLALRDLRACLWVTLVRVYCVGCVSITHSFAKFPKTCVSNENRNRQVKGICVDGAELVNAEKQPKLVCRPSGQWNISNAMFCHCKSGYTPSDNKINCIKCPHNTYKLFSGNGKCENCPQHTFSDSGAHHCLCNEELIPTTSLRNQSLCKIEILNTESTSWNGWVKNSGKDDGWQKHKNASNEKLDYGICVMQGGGQDYWLRSPFIILNEAHSIKIDISFTMRSCKSFQKQNLNCKEAIYLLMYEADSPSDLPSSWNESIYTNLTVVFPNIKWTDKGHNDNIVNVKTYSVELRKTGLFLALRDTGSCSLVNLFRVYYVACVPIKHIFAKYPQTGVSNENRNHKVKGSCVDGAELVNAKKQPNLVCRPSGRWHISNAMFCHCKSGYTPSDNKIKCIKCPRNTYKSFSGYGKCEICPQHTFSDSGANHCICNDELIPITSSRNQSLCKIEILNTESTSWNGWVKNSGKFDGWRKQNDPLNEQLVYGICAMQKTGRDYWLRSPFIIRNEAFSITIEISFTMRSCKAFPEQHLHCKETMYLLIYEAKSPSDVPSSWNKRIYTTLAVVSPKIEWIDKGFNDSIVNVKTYSFELSRAGFFLALHDTGTCSVVNLVRVYYVACVPITRFFAKYPRTGVSNENRNHKVKGVCVDGAELVSKEKQPSSVCRHSGRWHISNAMFCHCKRGYTPMNKKMKCIKCPRNTYKSFSGNGKCEICPQYRFSDSGSYTCKRRSICPGYTNIYMCLQNAGYTLFLRFI